MTNWVMALLSLANRMNTNNSFDDNAIVWNVDRQKCFADAYKDKTAELNNEQGTGVCI
ncbi:MAG: hypothetical protein FWH57_05590 [Oscillospiraceae bacterium]|nr:hypothetical protein [Oscillospiraceae bacterium]